MKINDHLPIFLLKECKVLLCKMLSMGVRGGGGSHRVDFCLVKIILSPSNNFYKLKKMVGYTLVCFLVAKLSPRQAPFIHFWATISVAILKLKIPYVLVIMDSFSLLKLHFLCILFLMRLFT